MPQESEPIEPIDLNSLFNFGGSGKSCIGFPIALAKLEYIKKNNIPYFYVDIEFPEIFLK